MAYKKEMQQLMNDMDEFRTSMNEWILFLNSQQRMSKEYIKILERRIRELELKKEVADRKF